ncbi:MAG: amidohydrolase family protein [Spirochaetes bacterium]|nr:amidohydrolase family protein [Spirochaetota bacterium]
MTGSGGVTERGKYVNRYSRRDFIKASAVAVATAAVPDGMFTGCATGSGRALPPIDYSAPLRLNRCSVIDVDSGRVIPDRTITIEKGILRSIEPTRPGNEARHTSLDLGGSYVMPGLIDAHCHLTLQSCGYFRTVDAAKYVSQIKRNGQMQVEAGVTTVRDMGSFPKMLHGLMDDYARDLRIGPRVVYCNAFTNIDGGHPDIRPSELSDFAPVSEALTGKMYLYYKNRNELMDGLRKNVEDGATFIKLTMDDLSLICGRGKIPVYSDDDLKTIFDFADSNGLPVAVHSLRYYGLKRALQYPVHSMEHITSDAVISDADIRTMARKKVSIVPTLIIGQTFAFRERYEAIPRAYETPFIKNELAIRDEYVFRGEHRNYDADLHRLNIESIQWFRDPGCAAMPKEKKFLTDPEVGFNCLLNGPVNARRMRNAGIRIGCGTDSGVPLHYHGSLWREMEMMTRIGFRNDEVLRSATINNAGILGAADAIGSLREGKRADILVLKDNPLRAIEALRSPLLVLSGGKVRYSAVDLKQNGAEAGDNAYAV